MWRVIYIAPGSHMAGRVKKLLAAEGLLVSERALGGGKEGPIEILVPKSEAEEAHEILHRALCDRLLNVRSRL